MLKKTSLIIFFLVFLCSAFSVHAQDRAPSTPEEKRRALEMATFLEEKPLAKEAEYRAKLFLFLATVPDITIKVCDGVLGDAKQIKGDYESEMTTQLIYSQAKYIIENPDKDEDDEAVYLAGVEGVLRTWQAIKAEKPKAKFKLMDDLIEKQQAGALAEDVKSRVGRCKNCRFVNGTIAGF